MKSFLNAVFLLLVFAGCAKKEESKFEAFSAEAFAFRVDNTWEVSSSFFVKGFELREKDGAFTIDLSYTVTVESPDGVKKEVFADKMQSSETEKIADKKLEAEFVLDSTYVPGKYTVWFSAKDNISGKTAGMKKELIAENTDAK